MHCSQYTCKSLAVSATLSLGWVHSVDYVGRDVQTASYVVLLSVRRFVLNPIAALPAGYFRRRK